MASISRLALLVFGIGLSGCSLPEGGSYSAFMERLGKEWNALIAVLQGESSPFQKPPGGKLEAQAGGEDQPSEQALRYRANAELLREIFLVVFLREPSDRASFGSYTDSINQGASLEGIYNGFTHSQFFRELEQEYRGSSAEALRAFAEELALLQAEAPEPVLFTRESARPLPILDKSDLMSGKGTAAKRKKPESSPPARQGATDLQLIFAGASFYTLKRVLGDEALRVMNTKKSDPEALSAWYGAWAGRLARKGVDFGLRPRNNPEPSFHAAWAKSAGEDRIKWEVLNRLHRLINEAQRKAQIVKRAT